MVKPIVDVPDYPVRPTKQVMHWWPIPPAQHTLRYWVKGSIGGFYDRIDRLAWLEPGNTAHKFTRIDQGDTIAESVIVHTDGSFSSWIIVHVVTDRGLVVGYVLRPTRATMYKFPDLVGIKIEVTID